jgi:tetratricopeptide (TPR) repeat protein
MDRNDEALQRALTALNMQQPKQAEEIAAQIVKRSPQNVHAQHVLGCALLLQGRSAEAIAPLEAAGRGRRDPEINTQLAIALRQMGRPDEALTRLKRAVKQRPPYPPAFRELGGLLFAMKQFGEAIEVLRSGLEAAPVSPDILIQLGYVLLQIKKLAEAKAAFGQALAFTPNDADALFGMAKAYRDSGELQPAANLLRRYLTSAPADQSGWLHLGNCLLDLGETEAAYSCFRTAARGDQRNFGKALASLAASGRGRLWLKPSAATRFMRDQ